MQGFALHPQGDIIPLTPFGGLFLIAMLLCGADMAVYIIRQAAEMALM